MSVPYFAAWRWGTIYKTVSIASLAFPILRRGWKSLKFVKNMRDTTLVRTLDAAMKAETWLIQCKYVVFESQFWIRLANWGTACSCHEKLRCSFL